MTAISDTQGRQRANPADSPPYSELTGLTCPICLQDCKVFRSRLALTRSWIKRHVFDYYRCEVCSSRFRLMKNEIATVVFFAMVIGFLLVVLPLMWAVMGNRQTVPRNHAGLQPGPETIVEGWPVFENGLKISKGENDEKAI
jgi:hypothetical protein